MSLNAEEFGARVRILNTPCTDTTYAELKEDLTRHCASWRERPLAVDFTNVHVAAMRKVDADFRAITDTMDLFVPDSMVLTWAVNWRGGRMRDRVYGPAFLSYMIEQSPAHLRHFFLGASQECLDQLIQRTRERNPDFQIAGSHHGYFGPEDEERILKHIDKAKADLVWVGLGTPKQQEWIHRSRDRVKAGALLAVGFAFDVNAGAKKDAPGWMQSAGLTWVYRLSQEPRRLWKRYLIYNSIFVGQIMMQRLREGAVRKPAAPLRLWRTQESPAPQAFTEYDPPRCNVLGVGISVMNLRRAAELVAQGAKRPGFAGFVTVTGVHGVMESQRDLALKRIHNRSFLSTPDGMPMVWLSRWNGFDGVDRVYGPDLILEVFRHCEERGRRHFLYGAGEGVAQKLADNLQARYPGAQIVGAVTPPYRALTKSESDELAEQLQETRPHFLWVGLSTPKQERFMHDFLEEHPDLCRDWDHGLVMIGVGAAFDIHAGRIMQAPRWMQRNGLEWFFRLCIEPRRLWKRYSINNTGFIFRIMQQLMEFRNYPLEK